MSWAAHELENFYFLKRLGTRISYLGLLVGALAPDFISKGFVTGFNIGGIHIQADNPAQWHRGWPGMGFTHTLIAALIFAGLIYVISRRNKAWFFGTLIGYSAHVITDMSDSVGTMLFWPIYNSNISIGMWAYGAEVGKNGDAIAYYSSLAFIMDAVWVLIVIVFAWRVLSSEYFHNVVQPADPAWAWIKRKFAVPDRALIAFYRAFFFYAICRVTAWTFWVHIVKGSPWDLSWGGPYWIPPFTPW